MRYIGIEIECIVDSVKKLIYELEQNNFIFLFVGIKNKHKLIKGIKLIRDNSIKSGTLEGIEINTPIFNDQTKDFNFLHLKKLCEILKKIETDTNESCSLHLHINNEFTTEKDMENIFSFFKNNEELILSIYHDIQLKKDNLNGKLSNYTIIDLQNNDIPKKVNLNIRKAYDNYKTIEIRCMCSTIDFEEIKKLIYFSLNYFEYGLKHSKTIFLNKEELLNSITDYYLNYNETESEYNNKKAIEIINNNELSCIKEKILSIKKEIYSLQYQNKDIERIYLLKKELRDLEIYQKIKF